MNRFTSILFSPLGEADNAAAVRRIADLARNDSAQLTMLGVTPEPSMFQHFLHRPEFFSEVQQADRDAMAKRLRRWANKHRNLGSGVGIDTGNPALRIIEAVIGQDHDLVVVARR